MAGLFSRLKIWNPGESLSASDLNGEFNHFLSNIDAEHSEGYSANLSEMQTTENPGGLGSENLTQPISVAQEIERLRYVINRIVGKSQWYESPSQSLQNLANIVAAPPTRIASGLGSAQSGFPKFLQADGSNGAKINASVGTPLVVYINNSIYSFTANITSGSLSTQPTANTATLASSLGGTQSSREVTEFTISSAGASISASVGKQAIFSINNGSATEYFLGTVKSSTLISGIKRGYFFDTSNNPVPSITLTTGHTITLLRTTYVFLKSDGTLQVTYNPPTYNSTAPTGAVSGDYWYDVANGIWMVYTGTWVNSNSVFVGMCAQNGTQTICARADNFYKVFSDLNSLSLAETTNTTVSTANSVPSDINVYGTIIHNDFKNYVWDITANLLSGETEAASTYYYLYLSNTGRPYISAVRPISEMSMYGWYHPYEAIRCVGYAFNDASSNLISSGLFSFLDKYYLSLSPTTTILTNNTSVTFTGLTSFTANAGDQYTAPGTNGTTITYTVSASVSASTTVTCTYSNTESPLNSCGTTNSGQALTLTRTVGSGTASSTYTLALGGIMTYFTPPNVKYLKIRMVGGGGGGGRGGASASPIFSGSGNPTVFSGQSVNGGTGAHVQTNCLGGLGGAATTIGSSFSGFCIPGARGSPSNLTSAAGGSGGSSGGNGASTFFGGGGSGGMGGSGATLTTEGGNGIKNTGSGGGGAGAAANSEVPGPGGGAGAYIEMVTREQVQPSYTYTIGYGGSGSIVTGLTVRNGGHGAAGIIIIEEYYND